MTKMFKLENNFNFIKDKFVLNFNYIEQSKEKSLIKFQKFYLRSVKSKRKLKLPDTKNRIKNHIGLMKRIRVVGPRWNRGFKYWPTGKVHKMTNKSSSNLKRKRQARYICKADLQRVKRLIPYFKRQKYKH